MISFMDKFHVLLLMQTRITILMHGHGKDELWLVANLGCSDGLWILTFTKN